MIAVVPAITLVLPAGRKWKYGGRERGSISIRSARAIPTTPPVHTDWLEGLSLFHLWVEGEGVDGGLRQSTSSVCRPDMAHFPFLCGEAAHSIPLPTSFVICTSCLDLSGPGLWDHLGHMLDFFFIEAHQRRDGKSPWVAPVFFPSSTFITL